MAGNVVDRETETDVYFAERGGTEGAEWAALDETTRDGAVLYAEDYVEANYLCLAWDEWQIVNPVPGPPGSAPDDVKQAINELAGWQALVAPLKTGLQTPVGGQNLSAASIGALSVSYNSIGGRSLSGQEFERWIDSLLTPLYCTKTRNSGVVQRVVTS